MGGSENVLGALQMCGSRDHHRSCVAYALWRVSDSASGLGRVAVQKCCPLPHSLEIGRQRFSRVSFLLSDFSLSSKPCSRLCTVELYCSFASVPADSRCTLPRL